MTELRTSKFFMLRAPQQAVAKRRVRASGSPARVPRPSHPGPLGPRLVRGSFVWGLFFLRRFLCRAAG